MRGAIYQRYTDIFAVIRADSPRMGRYIGIFAFIGFYRGRFASHGMLYLFKTSKNGLKAQAPGFALSTRFFGVYTVSQLIIISAIFSAK